MSQILSRKAHLESEAGFWQYVWNIQARVATFAGEPGLLMPYVPPCPTEDQTSQDIQTAVRIAMEELVRKRVNHGDVSWRHVGFYRIKGVLKAVLYDFSKARRWERGEVNTQATLLGDMLSRLGIQ